MDYVATAPAIILVVVVASPCYTFGYSSCYGQLTAYVAQVWNRSGTFGRRLHSQNERSRLCTVLDGHVLH